MVTENSNMSTSNSSNSKKRSRSTRKKRNKNPSSSTTQSLLSVTTKIVSAEVSAAEAKIITTTTTASSTIKKNNKKKPRLSKSEKRIRKQEAQKLLDDDNNGQNNNQKQKQQKQKQKQDVMTTKIDRILKCADQSLFTGSVIIDNDNDITNGDDDKRTTRTTNKTEATIQIVSGCDWNKSKERRLPTMTPTMTLLSMGGRMTMTRSRIMRSTAAATTTTTIRVKPLIILDINGILCHRIRKRHQTQQQNKLRSPIGMVAGTPVIPRTDLKEFFNYLDQHFCLAIWTSAKRKTVKKLLDLLLIPDSKKINNSNNNNNNNNIQNKFLFVWCQNECTKKVIAKDPNNSTRKKSTRDDNKNSSDDDDDDKNNNEVDCDGAAGDCDNNNNNNNKDYDPSSIIYEKHLSKVFKAFPLWSTNNTLLVDDSPEKCPVAISNCIHPPPIHGGQHNNKASHSNERNNGLLHTTPVHLLSDEGNEQRQAQFFQKLVNFWNNQPHATTVSSSSMEEDEISATTTTTTNTGYYQFLQENADGYMGWRRHGDLAINKTS